MPDHNRKILGGICDRELGFQPFNYSIKPVHVANGMARALTQRSYKTDALARMLRRFVIKQQQGVVVERNSNDDILKDFCVAFELTHDRNVPQRFSRLRELLHDVLGADGAVYEQENLSSYTLTNERFITKDPSDNRSGFFLARFLQAKHGDTQEAADYLLDLLRGESDPWTSMALPLLQFGEVREENNKGEMVFHVKEIGDLLSISNGRFNSCIFRKLRESFDRLARFEKTTGSKLNSLRRLVLFGCFTLHVHAISRWHEKNPKRPRPPILLDMFDGKVKSVRDASRAGLRAAGDAIEGLMIDCVKEIEQADTEQWNTMVESCEADAVHDQSNLEMMSELIVNTVFSQERGHPIGSLIELGRRSGFLSPWANSGRGGKLKKRYTATAEFLEILVAATVNVGESIEFPDFLARLRENYGILVGKPEDIPYIRHNNLSSELFGSPTSINEEDLQKNVTSLRNLLEEIGYGRSYADGRTIVTTDPVAQL